MIHVMRSIPIFILFAACNTAAAAASGVTPVVLIDTQLQPKRVYIHRLSQGTMSYFDEDRSLQIQPINRFVQLRQLKSTHSQEPPQQSDNPAADPKSKPPLGMVVLIDGQRWTGQWSGLDEKTQSIRWDHPFFGPMVFSLENLSAMSLKDTNIAGDPPQGADRLELINGDAMEGFISQVRTTGIELQLAQGGQAVVLPMARIAAMTLANPAQRHQGTRCMIWLTDGSRVLAELVSIADNQLLAQIAPLVGESQVTIPMATVTRIEFPAAEGYLIDLASLPMRVTKGGYVFGLSMGPHIQGSSIYLHAPVQVQFDLPPGASRLAATVRLQNEPHPTPASAWADAQIIVRQRAKPIAQHRLNAAHPFAAINTAVTGQIITIEVDASDNGPIMDRIVLDEAIIFVRTDAHND